MAYVSRTVEAVASSAPLLHVNQPHFDEHGSVAKEYKHRLSHPDARYGNDNEIIYIYLEEATCGTIFAASIKSFERARNCHGACLALNNQHTGKRKWRAILKEAENYINCTNWNGNTLVSLEKHINNLQSYYNDMEILPTIFPTNSLMVVPRFKYLQTQLKNASIPKYALL